MPTIIIVQNGMLKMNIGYVTTKYILVCKNRFENNPHESQKIVRYLGGFRLPAPGLRANGASSSF